MTFDKIINDPKAGFAIVDISAAGLHRGFPLLGKTLFIENARKLCAMRLGGSPFTATATPALFCYGPTSSTASLSTGRPRSYRPT